MKLVGRNVLDEFTTRYDNAKKWIGSWVAEIEVATWKNPIDVKERYNSVSFLGSNIAIFNVKGNQYRLEVKMSYETQTVLVTWAGSHEEYSNRYK